MKTNDLWTKQLTEDGGVRVKAPFNPGFEGKQHGGKYSKGVWTFSKYVVDKALAHVEEIYGKQGEPLVDVKITYSGYVKDNGEQYGSVYWAEMDDKEFFAFGQKVAWRVSRDSPARLAPNVILAEGSFPDRGGSAKNPRLDAEPGTALIIEGVPLSLVTPNKYTEILSDVQNTERDNYYSNIINVLESFRVEVEGRIEDEQRDEEPDPSELDSLQNEYDALGAAIDCVQASWDSL